MKKIGRLYKEIAQDQIKNRLRDIEGLFIVNYSGLSASDLNTLRQSLRNVDASLFVVKNKIAQTALKELNLDNLISMVEGPCGFVFTAKESEGICNVLYNFCCAHEQLKFKGGLLKDKLLSPKDMEALARLPSRAVLRAQAIMTLNSPISGLVMTLKQLVWRLVYSLDQIKTAKAQNNH